MRATYVGVLLLLAACGRSGPGGEVARWQAFGADARALAIEQRPKLLAATQTKDLAATEAAASAWAAEGARRLQGMAPPAIRNEAADLCTVAVAEGEMQFGFIGRLDVPVTITWHSGDAKAAVEVVSCNPAGAVLGRRALVRAFGITTGTPVAQTMSVVFPYERAGGDALAYVAIRPAGK